MIIFRSINYFNEKEETFEEWPYIFLHAPRHLFPEEEIDSLMWNSVDMIYLGEGSRKFKSDSYHAQLTRGKPKFLEGFYGVSVYVKLDMGSNKTDDLEVILLKK